MVTAMMINFLLMCITLISIKRVNPTLYNKITIIKNRTIQVLIGFIGSIIILIFLVIHTFKDLSSNVDGWYFHSTYIYLIVMTAASLYFIIRWNRVKTKNINTYKQLPLE